MFYDTNPFKPPGNHFLSPSILQPTEDQNSIRYTAKVSLRRSKRNEIIQNKRRQQDPSSAPKKSLETTLQELCLKSLDSIKTLRRKTCEATFNYYDLLKLCPKIIQLLSAGFSFASEELTYELLWIFSNLALGPPMLVNEISCFIPQLAQFVFSGKKTLAEQACWVIGNLSCESNEIKNRIKNVPLLLQGIVNLLSLNDISLASVSCWTLCNLIRGNPPDCYEILRAGVLLPAIKILKKPFSTQIVECLWLVSFLSNEPKDEVLSQIFSEEKQEIYKNYLEFDDDKIVLPTVRILGNGFLHQYNLNFLFKDSSFIIRVLKILKDQENQVKIESLWMLSNIFASDYVNIAMNFAGEDIIKSLIFMLKDESDDFKSEAGIAIYNLCEVSDSAYFLPVVELGKRFLVERYYQNINNIPTWVGFKLSGTIDVNLLQVSLGFIALCLEVDYLSFDIRQFLFDGSVKDAVEDCCVSFRKAGARTEDDFTILKLCEYILNLFGQGLFS